MRETEYDARTHRCRRGMNVSAAEAAASAMSAGMATVEGPSSWHLRL